MNAFDNFKFVGRYAINLNNVNYFIIEDGTAYAVFDNEDRLMITDQGFYEVLVRKGEEERAASQ